MIIIIEKQLRQDLLSKTPDILYQLYTAVICFTQFLVYQKLLICKQTISAVR